MRQRSQFSAGGIIEGEYVALPPDMPAQSPSAAPAAMRHPRHAGMEALRGRAKLPGVAFSSRGGAIFWLFGAVLIAGSFWIAGGHALVSR